MRYRIVIEIDTDASRKAVNGLATHMHNEAVTKWCNPVYVATEVVEGCRDIIMEKEH